MRLLMSSLLCKTDVAMGWLSAAYVASEASCHTFRRATLRFLNVICLIEVFLRKGRWNLMFGHGL